MITYSRSRHCEFGLSSGGSTVNGPLRFWARGKEEEVARFHIVEFPTASQDSTCTRGKSWELKKETEDGLNLQPNTKLVILHRNTVPIFRCRIDQEKRRFLSVTEVTPEEAAAELEGVTPPTGATANQPTVEASTPVTAEASAVTTASPPPVEAAVVTPVPKTKAPPRKRTKPVVETSVSSTPATTAKPAKPPRKRKQPLETAAST